MHGGGSTEALGAHRVALKTATWPAACAPPMRTSGCVVVWRGAGAGLYCGVDWPAHGSHEGMVQMMGKLVEDEDADSLGD